MTNYDSIQLKRGTTSQWNALTSPDNILLAGEIGVEQQFGVSRFKIGDGTTAWSSLPYYLSSFGGTFTGQIISTLANSTTTGGGQIYLNGIIGNRIDFNQNGVAVPAFTTRSIGTKLNIYPAVSGTTVDAALGIANVSSVAEMWYSIPNATWNHSWYGGTTRVATLSGTGNLNTSGTVNYGYTLIDVRYYPGTVTNPTVETIPNGTRYIRVRGVGGGAGGGGSINGTTPGAFSGGGGAGGYAEYYGAVVANGTNTLTITIGQGGAGGGSTANGTNGTSTTVVYFDGSTSTTLITGSGGTGGTGQNGNGTSAGGVGGGASSLNGLAMAGGNGGNGTAGDGKGLGANSAMSAVSNDPGTSNSGAAGKAYGGGGTGSASTSTTGRSGGAGADGIVVIEYFG